MSRRESAGRRTLAGCSGDLARLEFRLRLPSVSQPNKPDFLWTNPEVLKIIGRSERASLEDEDEARFDGVSTRGFREF